MQITITWEAVLAICAALTLAGGGFLWGVRAVIRDELAGFKAITEFRLDEHEKAIAELRHEAQRRAA